MALKSVDRERQVLEAARFYYEHNLNQSQIATKLQVSRPGVSRLLQEARDKGIVRIQIIDPGATGTRLEHKLKSQYGLKHIVVVPHDPDNGVLKSRLGSALIRLLDDLLVENCTLGVSWGSTMQAATEYLSPRSIKNMTVVQLNGGVSKAELDTHASEIAKRIGDNYKAIPYLLPLPAVVDSAELKSAIITDKHIAKTLNLAREAEIAAFTIGAFGSNSVLVQSDYFETEEVDSLLKQGAVADICSRLIKADGSICVSELNQRTIGIELDELQAKPFSIAVAGGVEKTPAIQAALAGKWFNCLITDELVAQTLLDEV